MSPYAYMLAVALTSGLSGGIVASLIVLRCVSIHVAPARSGEGS